MLTARQIDAFVASGFVRLDDAFPTALAEAGRAILWREIGLDPDHPAHLDPSQAIGLARSA